MSANLEITVVILSVALLLIVVFAVPFLLQLWRSAKNAAVTLEILNQRLPTILANLEEITLNVRKTTAAVNSRVEEVSAAIQKVQGVVSLAAGLRPLFPARLRMPRGIINKLGTVMAFFKGINVFLEVLRTGEKPLRDAGKRESRDQL
ncbi:MAG: DUF948 domain-containing protein [Smithellaceae bacterium]|nr:DUF948 domain-containing protein [Smithellaceae bacterium]